MPRPKTRTTFQKPAGYGFDPKGLLDDALRHESLEADFWWDGSVPVTPEDYDEVRAKVQLKLGESRSPQEYRKWFTLLLYVQYRAYRELGYLV